MAEKRMFFRDTQIFEYNQLAKKNSGITLILVIAFFAILIIYYAAFLRTLDTPITNAINSAASHIGTQIKDATLLGLFYSGFFGGLFFILIAMEGVFMAFLRGGNNLILVFLIYLAGIFLSYNVDYMIGRKLANVSKTIITPKKFYKAKGFLNRYGAWAIFIFNALPLPSQSLSAILGVFKYDRTRFNVLFMSGQAVKYLLIVLGYIFIF